MPTKEEIIIENQLLKKKLALAEAWMKREVAVQQKKLSQDSIKTLNRKQLDNVLEKESVDIVTRRIRTYFGDCLWNSPKHTLEHLIDAEIYWQTLQKFPTLDALPVVSSYQKILDAFFEIILQDFRKSVPKIKNPSDTPRSESPLDKDIKNVIEKKYTLSLGRWYQFFERLRSGDAFGGRFEDLFLQYLSENHEKFLETCITDPFFSVFSELISLEVFGRKRHDIKVSYADARRVREICIGNYVSQWILKTLF